MGTFIVQTVSRHEFTQRYDRYVLSLNMEILREDMIFSRPSSQAADQPVCLDSSSQILLDELKI